MRRGLHTIAVILFLSFTSPHPLLAQSSCDGMVIWTYENNGDGNRIWGPSGVQKSKEECDVLYATNCFGPNACTYRNGRCECSGAMWRCGTKACGNQDGSPNGQPLICLDQCDCGGGSCKSTSGGGSSAPDAGSSPTTGGSSNAPKSTCGNGVIEGSEQCDGGTCCAATCTFEESSTSCRLSSGSCDLIETCTGDSADCPTDILKSSKVKCRDETPNCATTLCSGNSAACPAASCIQGMTPPPPPLPLSVGTPAPAPAPAPIPAPQPVCGNGKLEQGERCDDGNTKDEDGCSAACKSEEETIRELFCCPQKGLMHKTLAKSFIKNFLLRKQHVQCNPGEALLFSQTEADAKIRCDLLQQTPTVGENAEGKGECNNNKDDDNDGRKDAFDIACYGADKEGACFDCAQEDLNALTASGRPPSTTFASESQEEHLKPVTFTYDPTWNDEKSPCETTTGLTAQLLAAAPCVFNRRVLELLESLDNKIRILQTEQRAIDQLIANANRNQRSTWNSRLASLRISADRISTLFQNLPEPRSLQELSSQIDSFRQNLRDALSVNAVRQLCTERPTLPANLPRDNNFVELLFLRDLLSSEQAFLVQIFQHLNTIVEELRGAHSNLADLRNRLPPDSNNLRLRTSRLEEIESMLGSTFRVNFLSAFRTIHSSRQKFYRSALPPSSVLTGIIGLLSLNSVERTLSSGPWELPAPNANASPVTMSQIRTILQRSPPWPDQLATDTLRQKIEQYEQISKGLRSNLDALNAECISQENNLRARSCCQSSGVQANAKPTCRSITDNEQSCSDGETFLSSNDCRESCKVSTWQCGPPCQQKQYNVQEAEQQLVEANGKLYETLPPTWWPGFLPWPSILSRAPLFPDTEDGARECRLECEKRWYCVNAWSKESKVATNGRPTGNLCSREPVCRNSVLLRDGEGWKVSCGLTARKIFPRDFFPAEENTYGKLVPGTDEQGYQTKAECSNICPGQIEQWRGSTILLPQRAVANPPLRGQQGGGGQVAVPEAQRWRAFQGIINNEIRIQCSTYAQCGSPQCCTNRAANGQCLTSARWPFPLCARANQIGCVASGELFFENEQACLNHFPNAWRPR